MPENNIWRFNWNFIESTGWVGKSCQFCVFYLWAQNILYCFLSICLIRTCRFPWIAIIHIMLYLCLFHLGRDTHVGRIVFFISSFSSSLLIFRKVIYFCVLILALFYNCLLLPIGFYIFFRFSRWLIMLCVNEKNLISSFLIIILLPCPVSLSRISCLILKRREEQRNALFLT